MKKKSYWSYFILLLSIAILCGLIFIQDNENVFIALLALIYLCMGVNIYYTVRAKLEKEKMGVEIFFYSVIWIPLLMILTERNVYMMAYLILAYAVVGVCWLILPIIILNAILRYRELFVKKDKPPEE